MADHDAHALQDFFASCPDMLFIADLDGRLQSFSEPLRRALGPSAAVGVALADLVDPNDHQTLASALRWLEENAEPTQLTLRFRGAQPMSLSARRSASGDALYGSLHPVHARPTDPKADRSLRERLLDHVIDNINLAIWAVDSDGTFIYHDGKGLERAGLQRGQFLGSNIFQLYAGQKGSEIVKRALRGEQSHERNQTHGVHWENWVIPLRSAAGGVDGAMGISLDISEAMIAEEELRSRIHQIEQQQQVIRNLSTPIIEVWNGVLTLPMIGVVDSVRTAEVMDSLLTRIVEKQARFAILDLTGVEVVDTRVASHLIELVTAIKLLGAEGIVAGIKPNVAQTMVALGLDLSQILTQRNLRAALGYCIRRMNPPAAPAQPAANGGPPKS